VGCHRQAVFTSGTNHTKGAGMHPAEEVPLPSLSLPLPVVKSDKLDLVEVEPVVSVTAAD